MESHPCAALPALLKPAFHRFPAACTKPALLGQVLQCQQQVTRLRGEIKAADAVLFVTAEYNRSIPGVLKNAIDHASRPWGKSVWGGKPVGVVGVSVGAAGTCMAQQHLRNVISYLNMPQFGQPEMFIQWKEGLVKDGAIGPDSKDFVQKYVDTFAAWVKKQVG